jgi:hypothetical protein
MDTCRDPAPCDVVPVTSRLFQADRILCDWAQAGLGVRSGVKEQVDTTQFRTNVLRLESRTLTEIAMTLADRFRQEGREAGLQEGRRNAVLLIQRALLGVLSARMGPVPVGL